MPVLYKARKDKIHIYPNRKPKANGGDPLLIWMWLDIFFLALVVIPVILFILLTGEARREQTALLVMTAIFIWDVGYICWLFRRITFSVKDRKVYNAIFFVSWGKKSFNDIANIDISEQERTGHTNYSYIANLVDEDAPPLRLSPYTRTMNHLSRYYHEIIPLLLSLPGMEGKAAEVPLPADDSPVAELDGDDSAQYIPDNADADDIVDLDVAVETVEVPVEDADDLLAGRSDSAAYFATGFAAAKEAEEEEEIEKAPRRRGKPTRAGKKEKPAGKAAKDGVYTRRGNVYSRSLWPYNLLVLFVTTLVIGGIWVLFMPFLGEFVRIGVGLFWIGTYLHMLYQMSRENMDIHIDMDRRVFRFRTFFGLSRREYGFDKLTHFNMKSQLGIHGLCMGLKNHKVDPTVIASFSSKKIKDVYRKTCEIMELDPKKYWKS